MDPLITPAKGAFTISTTWTSTGPFKDQTAAFINEQTALLNPVTRSIYTSAGGNLRVIMFDGSTGLFPNVPAGVVFPCRAIALSSQNAATGLVGLY